VVAALIIFFFLILFAIYKFYFYYYLHFPAFSIRYPQIDAVFNFAMTISQEIPTFVKSNTLRVANSILHDTLGRLIAHMDLV
jgi:hypothetical protein